MKIEMLKLRNINRILFRNLSSKSEGRYVGDVVQSLDTELQPLQVKDFLEEMLTVLCVQAISRYYFDGSGKGIRPQITRLMADACNQHLKVILERRRNQVTPLLCSKFQLLLAVIISSEDFRLQS